MPDPKHLVQIAEQFLPDDIGSNEETVEIPLWLVLELIGVAGEVRDLSESEIRRREC